MPAHLDSAPVLSGRFFFSLVVTAHAIHSKFPHWKPLLSVTPLSFSHFTGLYSLWTIRMAKRYQLVGTGFMCTTKTEDNRFKNVVLKMFYFLITKPTDAFLYTAYLKSSLSTQLLKQEI